MNKSKSPIVQNQPKILSPRDDFKQEFKFDAGVMTPERIEKELESSLLRDLETLVKRLSKMDFS